MFMAISPPRRPARTLVRVRRLARIAALRLLRRRCPGVLELSANPTSPLAALISPKVETWAWVAAPAWPVGSWSQQRSGLHLFRVPAPIDSMQ